ncbi:hypothetical protein CYMTET_4686 [Cymbomonas tetramitiformis]|uniref:Protein kinase domain-containing protein n=1 Tax=Cymbomonas tetramitiformis TaxID=36881 RepID=A0AAE0H0W9_9CHLO|nr:hypothetical protein CYMTET_4686 [Cymbomonas tetramitiformis]
MSVLSVVRGATEPGKPAGPVPKKTKPPITHITCDDPMRTYENVPKAPVWYDFHRARTLQQLRSPFPQTRMCDTTRTMPTTLHVGDDVYVASGAPIIKKRSDESYVFIGRYVKTHEAPQPAITVDRQMKIHTPTGGTQTAVDNKIAPYDELVVKLFVVCTEGLRPFEIEEHILSMRSVMRNAGASAVCVETCITDENFGCKTTFAPICAAAIEKDKPAEAVYFVQVKGASDADGAGREGSHQTESDRESKDSAPVSRSSSESSGSKSSDFEYTDENSVTVEFAPEAGGYLFNACVMPAYPSDLHAYMRAHRTSMSCAARFKMVIALLRLVECITKLGKVYMDLKPANIAVWCASDNTLKLSMIDLDELVNLKEITESIADNNLEVVTRDITRGSTCTYPAPEVPKYTAHCTPYSNRNILWSLAVTILCVVTADTAQRALSSNVQGEDRATNFESALEFNTLPEGLWSSESDKKLSDALIKLLRRMTNSESVMTKRTISDSAVYLNEEVATLVDTLNDA